MDASVADVLLPEHTQEVPLTAHVEHIYAAAIGKGGRPCFRAIQQNGDHQSTIYCMVILVIMLMRCLRSRCSALCVLRTVRAR